MDATSVGSGGENIRRWPLLFFSPSHRIPPSSPPSSLLHTLSFLFSPAFDAGARPGSPSTMLSARNFIAPARQCLRASRVAPSSVSPFLQVTPPRPPLLFATNRPSFSFADMRLPPTTRSLSSRARRVLMYVLQEAFFPCVLLLDTLQQWQIELHGSALTH